MDRWIDEIAKRSFHRSPAERATPEIARVRSEHEAEIEGPSCYEVVLGPAESAHLPWDLLPRFAYHLRAKGLEPRRSPQVFVAVFVGDDLYFLHSRDFVDVLLEKEGLTPKDISSRIAEWQRFHQAPLLLTAGPGA
jgi:hypothetical protein